MNDLGEMLPESENSTLLLSGRATQEVFSHLDFRIAYDADGKEKNRKIAQTVRNFEKVIRFDSRFTGKIKFNSFSGQIFLRGSIPWEKKENFRPWGSGDDSNLFSVIQSEYGLTNRQDFHDALNNVALSEKFHPVCDVLNLLPYAGDGYIRNLVPDYLGAEDSDYTFQVMKLFMLGAVARVFQPGCKFDYTIIFAGRQGLGKSTFLRMLALDDSWFNDSLGNLDSESAPQNLRGSWIVELAELSALARTSGGIESVKRFLTATQDKYRLPYERRADIFLRQSVFAGTTNQIDFLQDQTGNRRFLIVQVGVKAPKKNLFEANAIEDIKRAWAEAVHIYKSQQPLSLVLPDSCAAEASSLQSAAMEDTGESGLIEKYVSGKDRVCAIEIWQEALGEYGRPTRYHSAKINNILNTLPGWARMKSPCRFGKYGSQRGFQRLQSAATSVQHSSGGFQNTTDFEQMEIPF